MSPNIERYEPLIRQILNAPGVDLSTISAKRVRKQLIEMDISLSAEFVREHKEDFDRIIATVYEEISAAQNGTDTKGKRESRAEEEDGEEDYANGDGEEEDGEEEVVEAKPMKAKKARKGGLTDEDLARQLDSEINGRQRTPRASSTRGRGRGGKRGGKRDAKSSATVNSDGEVADDDGEVVKKKRRGGGFQKEYALSEPLAAVTGVEKLSRPQCVKKLWDHIRGNNLQNPDNKREIVCDDKFRAVFNVDRIDMFAMNKQLGRHLRELEPDA